MRLCFSNETPYLDTNSIFLAGPTKRNSFYSTSWRSVAVKYLNELNFTGTVYIPEYTDGTLFDSNYIEKQTEWEWDCLDTAGVILFWVPRKITNDENTMPGFTTNVEFGIYSEKKPSQIILGYPNDAEKMRYLEQRYCTVTGKKSCKTLYKSIVACLDLLEFNKKNLIK